MAFIDRVVGPDEELVGIVAVHWIYGLKGLLWMTGFALLGLGIESQVERLVLGHLEHGGPRGLEMLSDAVFWGCIATGVFVLLFYVIMMLTTELGLTTKRVIYKRGWIAVDVTEEDLEEIKACDVDNGLLGRIFNYGYILIDARFVENLQLPAVNDPYRFVKAMNDMRSRLKEDQDIRSIVGKAPAHNPSSHAEAPQQSGRQGPGPNEAKTFEPGRSKHHAPPPPPENPQMPPSPVPPGEEEQPAEETGAKSGNDPQYNIHDDRYEGLESNMMKAAQNMVEDSREVANIALGKAEHDAKSEPEPQEETGPQDTQPQQTQDAEEGEGFKTSGIVTFKRGMRNRREALRDKVYAAFSRETHKPASDQSNNNG